MGKYRTKGSIALIITGSVLILVLTGLYWGRNGILCRMVGKRILRTEQKYGLSIRYDALRMKGLNEIELSNLSVVPDKRDTLLTLHALNMRLSFWKLLRGKIEVRNVTADRLKVSFIKADSTANYDFLFLKKEQEVPAGSAQADYAHRVNRILNLLYGFLPENGTLRQVDVSERKDRNFVAIRIPQLSIRQTHFTSDIEVQEDSVSQHWTTCGEVNRSHHTLKAELYAQHKEKIALPYLKRRFGADIRLDTLTYSLTESEGNSGQIILTGQAAVNGLEVYHKALSPQTVNLDRGQISYRVLVGKEFAELDSTTLVQFNQMQLHPYLKAEKREHQWHFTAALNKSWFPANELFGSLPKGLFSNLEGIKTDGELSYHFLLDVDFALPDSLKLESELKERNFRIVKYGATDLGKMSEEFIYTAYENGQPVRTFPIGPSWEHFTPLDSISPLLQMSVMQSEDGAFYYHRGFLPDAMREALIQDLKVKRFARGGSTITMQLVKNVFLNRNKNIARKLEEALIVWLIETERLTSKDRMYEVYLNIVEWGPLVYGAQEAAAYYFKKRPSQLTAEESIFLASIIPKPKHFRNSFTGDMKLKENLEGYYRLIAERLAKKGVISEAAADSIRPEINVTGEARKDLERDSIQ